MWREGKQYEGVTRSMGGVDGKIWEGYQGRRTKWSDGEGRGRERSRDKVDGRKENKGRVEASEGDERI